VAHGQSPFSSGDARAVPLKSGGQGRNRQQHSMLMRLSFRATSFSASKISGDCENDASAS
jgi:hypothetical protein